MTNRQPLQLSLSNARKQERVSKDLIWQYKIDFDCVLCEEPMRQLLEHFIHNFSANVVLAYECLLMLDECLQTENEQLIPCLLDKYMISTDLLFTSEIRHKYLKMKSIETSELQQLRDILAIRIRSDSFCKFVRSKLLVEYLLDNDVFALRRIAAPLSDLEEEFVSYSMKDFSQTVFNLKDIQFTIQLLQDCFDWQLVKESNTSSTYINNICYFQSESKTKSLLIKIFMTINRNVIELMNCMHRSKPNDEDVRVAPDQTNCVWSYLSSDDRINIGIKQKSFLTISSAFKDSPSDCYFVLKKSSSKGKSKDSTQYLSINMFQAVNEKTTQLTEILCLFGSKSLAFQNSSTRKLVSRLHTRHLSKVANSSSDNSNHRLWETIRANASVTHLHQIVASHFSRPIS